MRKHQLIKTGDPPEGRRFFLSFEKSPRAERAAGGGIIHLLVINHTLWKFH